jgi:hypothetical protein
MRESDLHILLYFLGESEEALRSLILGSRCVSGDYNPNLVNTLQQGCLNIPRYVTEQRHTHSDIHWHWYIKQSVSLETETLRLEHGQLYIY